MSESDFRMDGRVRALCFDLDDTLWDIAPVIARADRRLHEWLAESHPRIAERWTAADLLAARRQLALEHPERAYDYTWLRLTIMQRCALEVGYDEEVAQLAFEVWFGARNEVDPYPDVVPALRRLGDRFALATLSNGNADLRRIGLAPLFTVSLNAREIGAAKPHPAVFERIAAELALERDEVLYVGDDPLVDVAGARAAGLRTAWMNRAAREWPMDVEPADLEVRHCEELAELLLAQGQRCR